MCFLASVAIYRDKPRTVTRNQLLSRGQHRRCHARGHKTEQLSKREGIVHRLATLKTLPENQQLPQQLCRSQRRHDAFHFVRGGVLGTPPPLTSRVFTGSLTTSEAGRVVFWSGVAAPRSRNVLPSFCSLKSRCRSGVPQKVRPVVRVTTGSPRLSLRARRAGRCPVTVSH